MSDEKSEVWKRARAGSIAKSILTKLYAEEYEEIYKKILREEFGLDSIQKPRTRGGLYKKYLALLGDK